MQPVKDSVPSSYTIFATSNPNSASHFATFANVFKNNGREYYVIAGAKVKAKFTEQNVEVNQTVESLADPALLQTIGKLHQKAKYVLVDGADPHAANLLEKFKNETPDVKRYVYYDNPEKWVTTNYAESMLKASVVADGVVFANANLVNQIIYLDYSEKITMPWNELPKFGIGYYPVEQSEALKNKRADTINREKLRRDFFEKHQIEDRGQKLLVYSGGNNDDYFNSAFRYFILLLQNAYNKDPMVFENLLIVFQQHPIAKKENKDGNLLKDWQNKMDTNIPKVILSHWSTDQVSEFCDKIFYFQTSMSPRWVLGGLPATQVNYDSVMLSFIDPFEWTVYIPDSRDPAVMEQEKLKFYQENMVRSGYIKAVIFKEEFLNEIRAVFKTDKKPSCDEAAIKQAIGYREDWKENLLKI